MISLSFVFIVLYTCTAFHSHYANLINDSNLIIKSANPFNAETSPNVLCKNFITSNDNFYTRNHGDIPIINPNRYRLFIDGIGIKQQSFTLNQIKKFPEHSIIATLMCAGNRRNELTKIKEIKGTPWDIGAIGNAKWSGTRLKDVLEFVGAQTNNPCLHVQFEGYDKPKDNQSYRISIPMTKAGSFFGDVILAFKMNDELLSPRHGAPLRVIVPGYIGARSCKWLKRITIQNVESDGYFQQKDYKFYQPQVGIDNIDTWYQKVPPVQESNVQSAMCTNNYENTFAPLNIKGYAFAGGGRKITQVSVSFDDGSTWKLAQLLPQEMNSKNYGNINWHWTLWNTTLHPDSKICNIMVRAWDIAGNTQPSSLEEIWNIRGILNNAWHKINLCNK